MKRIWLSHIISLLLVSGVLITAISLFNKQQIEQQKTQSSAIKSWINADFINFDDPFQRALFLDLLEFYESQGREDHSLLLQKIDRFREQQIIDIQTGTNEQILSAETAKKISAMYLKFAIIYFLTLAITFYCVQSFGLWRFVSQKQKRKPYFEQIYLYLKNTDLSKKIIDWPKQYWPVIEMLIKAVIKAFIYLLLFSPAYVIAYSFRTRFDTDFSIFMIALGVISNALLVTYTHKFYTFLVHESKAGYVQTAKVKGLSDNFGRNVLPLKKIFSLKKRFPGHVLEHIFENARFQYWATLKEQASFLVTGLIIIEMALNIQGHLCYELLQQFLYKNFAIAFLIILLIFYLVKLTEIGTDWWIQRENSKTGNK